MRLREHLRKELFTASQQNDRWTHRFRLTVSHRAFFPTLAGAAVVMFAVVLVSSDGARNEPISTFSELPASELPQRARSAKILTAASDGSNEQACQLAQLSGSDQFICRDAARQANLDIGQTLILSR